MMLITGHKGFVGSYATQTFPDHVGYDAVLGDDLCDGARLRELFTHHTIDTVLHLAAKAGARGETGDPSDYISTNMTGTQHLLSLSEEFGVSHFIHFSSSSIYGEQPCPNSETTPFDPRGLYGVTKAGSEMLCRIARVPTTIVRPFTLYGKNGRIDQVVYKWLTCYKEGKPAPFYGDGTTRRGYTHVEDVIDGVACILKKGPPQSGHDTYNLGGAEIVTLRRLADIFKSESPNMQFAMLPKPDADVFENWADISKAQRELGWAPKRDFETEMRAIIRDFKNTL